ncbi:hypothetical protein F2Q70_00009829 [Brassica cretica]|uniref:Uncharacterized protein n=1 Tax=Brassica cretica TaxID=69181 RepID=A0A8S9M0E2_BRACR|nr:hypothetical protein F2Q70_00009829 [Brassica cretica]
MMESRRHATVVVSLLLQHLTRVKTQGEGTSPAKISMMGTATYGNGGMWLLQRR